MQTMWLLIFNPRHEKRKVNIRGYKQYIFLQKGLNTKQLVTIIILVKIIIIINNNNNDNSNNNNNKTKRKRLDRRTHWKGAIKKKSKIKKYHCSANKKPLKE